jgi:hypothetical protein
MGGATPDEIQDNSVCIHLPAGEFRMFMQIPSQGYQGIHKVVGQA